MLVPKYADLLKVAQQFSDRLDFLRCMGVIDGKHIVIMTSPNFSIHAQRWRIYQRRMLLSPEIADRVIKGTYVLHNIPVNATRHNYSKSSK